MTFFHNAMLLISILAATCTGEKIQANLVYLVVKILRHLVYIPGRLMGGVSYCMQGEKQLTMLPKMHFHITFLYQLYTLNNNFH